MTTPTPTLPYPDEATAEHAGHLGMWVFLGTEILLFSGLFVGYAYYRFLFPVGWSLAIAHTHKLIGSVNTILLLTSSLTVALSLAFAKERRRCATTWMLLASIALGVGFLVLKGVEYQKEIVEGALPGKYFHADFHAPGVELFESFYWIATGLHALHLTIGLGLLTWVLGRTRRGTVATGRPLALELVGLYWHLIDLIWIFLWPLLYLTKT